MPLSRRRDFDDGPGERLDGGWEMRRNSPLGRGRGIVGGTGDVVWNDLGFEDSEIVLFTPSSNLIDDAVAPTGTVDDEARRKILYGFRCGTVCS